MDMVLARIVMPISKLPGDLEVWKRLKKNPIVTGAFMDLLSEDGAIVNSFVVSAERIFSMFERNELEKIFKLPIETIEQSKLYSFPPECVLVLAAQSYSFVFDKSETGVSLFYCFFDKIIKLKTFYGKSKTRTVDCECDPLFFGKGWSLI